MTAAEFRAFIVHHEPPITAPETEQQAAPGLDLSELCADLAECVNRDDLGCHWLEPSQVLTVLRQHGLVT